MSGTIVGIEKQKIAVGKDTVEVEMLNLWCSDGMRSLKMSEIQRVRFLNPIMDSEFRKALETLALSHDTQKKAVSINFVGDGKREVQVGYVIENPIWKTSYRLVLDKKEQAVPARLGHRREPDRRGLEGRAHGPGVRPADLASRWTCISRCTCRVRWSSRNCSPRCGRRPTAATWRRQRLRQRQHAEAARTVP